MYVLVASFPVLIGKDCRVVVRSRTASGLQSVDRGRLSRTEYTMDDSSLTTELSDATKALLSEMDVNLRALATAEGGAHSSGSPSFHYASLFSRLLRSVKSRG